MKKLFDMTLIQEHDIEMGKTDKGYALVVPTDGGKFQGEISGIVEPIGMGVVYMKEPGKNDIESTSLLTTDDGARIIMEMKGIFDVEPETEEKLESGEYVSPEEYYHKGVVTFNTDAEQYKWLERKVCVSVTEIKSWTEVVTSVYMY